MSYSFGTFQLFVERRQLLLEGVPVRLGARAFDLLVALAQRSGEIVSKEELIDQVWPNVTVEEVALRVHLSALRKVLQSGGLGNAPISNVPGRGYALTMPVERIADQHGGVSSPPGTGAGRLPSIGKRLIGRDGIVDVLRPKLSQSDVLSIVGPGGIGKTSMALMLAETIAKDYPDGVIFADLATIADPALLWSMLANAAGLEMGASDAAQTMIAAFRDRKALLILDNCEHLVEPAATVADRLAAELPLLDILATSREALRATNEYVFRLPPLAIPADEAMSGALDYPAIRLLIDRVTAHNDTFALKDDDIVEAVGLCRRLDGIPLAIELVAASIGTFGLRAICTRLDEWFLPVLRGPRSAGPRHQTLVAVLDSSFDLLSDTEKQVLLQLSIFQGSFDLSMAIAIVTDGDRAPTRVLEAIRHLHDHSLISADLGGEDIEYRLLETTRVYARDRLRRAGLHELAARRHAEVVLAMMVKADEEWDTAARLVWIDHYSSRLADLRAALAWALADEGDPHIAAGLLSRGAVLWSELGLAAEFHGYHAIILDRVASGLKIDPQLEMRLKLAWAGSWTTHGTSQRMLEASEAGLALAEHLDAPRQKMQAYWLLWNSSAISGRFDEKLIGRIHRLAETSTDPVIQLAAMRVMALTHHYQGRQDVAWSYQTRIDRFDDLTFHKVRRIANYGDQKLSRITLEARLLWLRGYPDQALAAARRGVAHAEALCNSGGRAYFLGFAACPVALWSGNADMADVWIRELTELSSAYGFIFWQNLGEMYAKIASRLSVAPNAVGEELPPDAEHRYLLNQLQLFASFHPGFVAPSVLAGCEDEDFGWCQVEALRAKAMQSADADAQAILRNAIRIAGEQGALSLELRAATDLARLLGRSDRADQGVEMLTATYDRFTEGFDTLDLERARTLIAGLRVPVN